MATGTSGSTTINFDLILPGYEDDTDVDDLNENFKTIDGELYDATQAIAQNASAIQTVRDSLVRKISLNTAQFAGYVNSGSEAFSFEVLPPDGIWRTVSFDFRGKNIIFYKNGSPIGSVHLS